MANALGKLFGDIASAIKIKRGEPETVKYKPAEFPSKISEISVGNNDDIEAIEDALDAINGEVIGETLYTVTFIGVNGETLCQVPVYEGADCPDPSKDGTIETPTKEGTKYFGYRHSGWSMTSGGKADASALKKINQNRTVYVAFEEYEILLASGECAPDTWGDRSKWKINPDYILTIYDGDDTGSYYGETVHPWLAYQDKIVKVVLEEGVRYAGMYAFEKMVSLAEVVLPSTLRTISQGSFGGCASLKSITIPAGTVHLYEYCFGNYYPENELINDFYLSNVVFERTSGWTHQDRYNSSDSVSVLASQLQNPADAAEMLRNHFNRHWVNTEAS